MPELPKKLRGRPRNDAANLKVLKAARDLLAEGGIAAVTIEELAARAGISRPTIYRSWPNAKAVAMAALIDATAAPPAAAGGPVRLALTRVVKDLVEAFSTPAGRSAAELIAAADHSTELAKAFRHHLLLKVRERVLEILREGVKRGDIRKRADLEAGADIIMAPVFFRLMVGHQPLSAGFAEIAVKQALEGLSTRN
ncbi:MAG: TetR/AcrR family transcriptional regulator [Rhodospirillales bacterium]|nr:TetR/AcrR family transcriptional regulator [Rhodospirillales bacterium]